MLTYLLFNPPGYYHDRHVLISLQTVLFSMLPSTQSNNKERAQPRRLGMNGHGLGEEGGPSSSEIDSQR